MKPLPAFLILLMAASFTGCNVINPEEQIPSYLFLDHASFTAIDPDKEGPASHNISNVWLYINPQLVGVYEMPLTFPVLASGPTEFILAAGIMVNGIYDTRVNYPFYKLDTIWLTLEPTKTDTLRPSYEYIPATKFAFFEGFETSNNMQNTERIAGVPDIRYGEAAGRILIEKADSLHEAISSVKFSLPGAGVPVFMELDYKNTHSFQVGLRAENSEALVRFYKVTVAPRGDWNKIYIDFSEEATSLINAEYQVLIRVQTGPVLTTPAQIWLDNLKLVHL